MGLGLPAHNRHVGYVCLLRQQVNLCDKLQPMPHGRTMDSLATHGETQQAGLA